MSTAMAVPVTIAPDALAFVERSGQRQEFELMIDWAKHLVPSLSSIEVALDERAHDVPARVIFWTHRDDVRTDDDPTQRSRIGWRAATLPPEVCQSFVLLPVYRANGR
jgi:hypothetical protein